MDLHNILPTAPILFVVYTLAELLTLAQFADPFLLTIKVSARVLLLTDIGFADVEALSIVSAAPFALPAIVNRVHDTPLVFTDRLLLSELAISG